MMDVPIFLSLLDAFIPQPRLTYEQEVARKLSEIILTIHARKEFVSRERVQSELFNYFGVNSWKQVRRSSWLTRFL